MTTGEPKTRKSTTGQLDGEGSSKSAQLTLLIQRAREGDQLALQALMTKCAELVKWQLRQQFRQDSNEADIEELANRVFYKMIRGLPGLKRECSFKPWLMKIAKNVANSYLRLLVRRRNIGKLPEKGAELAIDDKVNEHWEDQRFPVYQQRFADQHDASIRRIDRERALRKFKSRFTDPLLRQIFKSLPPQYRAVLWDAEVNELSHDEIAQKHGWASSEVSRQKLHQAMKAIAELPLPVVTVEIDEQGHTRAFKWDRTPLDPAHSLASL